MNLALFVLFGVLLHVAHAHNFSIGVLSDSPYGLEQVQNLPKLIAYINTFTPALRSVVHLGDIKLGSDQCNDSYFHMVKRDYFDAIDAPLVYTPGDNEWTDCHRDSNGNFNPLERLQKLRTIFFPVPGVSTGSRSPISVASQAFDCKFSEFVENSLWQIGPIVLATIHIVGSNNDRRPWDQLPSGDFTDARVHEYELRDLAARAWLQKTFERAEGTQASGVLLFIHGDMWPAFELTNNIPLYGFDYFAQALSRHAAKFNRPVWLINGDSHDFNVKKPFVSDAVHPLTKFFDKPDIAIYRIHGEEYDAPLFTALTAETADRFDGPGSDENYDPDMVFEWLEVQVRPELDELFKLRRHKIFK